MDRIDSVIQRIDLHGHAGVVIQEMELAAMKLILDLGIRDVRMVHNGRVFILRRVDLTEELKTKGEER